MGTLSGFLKGNKKENTLVKYIASANFEDEDGNKLEWDLKAISCKQDDAIRKDCTKTIKNNIELDFDKYTVKLCVASIISPNLNDVELQESYGVMCAEDLLPEMLTPGEMQKLKIKVQEINGYGETMTDLVEEAKN